MRITSFGATGLLGKALRREWREDEFTGFGSSDGDIRNDKEVAGLVRHSRPDWIILAAAYTDVGRTAAFPQHRLRLRWNENDSL